MSKILKNLVVLSLLLFAFSEAMVSQPCSDKLGGLSLPTVQAKTKNTISEIQNTKSTSGKEKRVEPSPVQDDPSQTAGCDECFCCCSHILPTQAFTSQTVTPDVPSARTGFSTFPLSPPRDTFHPPRSA